MIVPAPQFFDTHTHPAVPPEIMSADYVAKADEAGVRFLMLSSAHLAAARYYAQMAAEHPRVWFAAGLHPHDAERPDLNPWPDFDIFESHPKLAAVGEIGLDYFYNFSGRDIQIKTFEYFLNLALKWNLPSIIHCRDKSPDGPAYEDTFAILKNFVSAGGTFVMHCFAGSVAMAERCWEMGGYTGITGIVTFGQGENIRENVRRAPWDRLLLETDSPYLAPVPFRGKPNHPSHIPVIAQTVSAVRGVSLEKVAEQTTRNAFHFFRLPSSLNPYQE